MTLDGLQATIYRGLHGRDYEIDYVDGHMLRYADDILVTARTDRSVNRILHIIKSFLIERGLVLSEAKTKIVNMKAGFDFLSRHYELRSGKLISTPSEAAINKFELSLRDTILRYRGGQKALIEKLNRQLIGWANYHKVSDAKEAFQRIDATVKALLLELCERLHPGLSRKRIIRKYFFAEPDGEHVYALVNKPDVRVIRLAESVVLYHHRAVSIKRNPYLDGEYYESRTNERAIDTVTGKYKAVWLRQNGLCYYCGKPILIDQQKQVVPIDVDRKNTAKNLAYVHDYCVAGQAEFYDCDDSINTPFDLHNFLRELKAKQTPANSRVKIFAPLTEYLRHKREATFSLSFREIEKILGRELCKSAKTRTSYWYMSGESRLSHSWLSNGYKIRGLSLEKGTVVFQRIEKTGVAVEIPTVFLDGRLPERAAAELKLLLKYIMEKYGL